MKYCRPQRVGSWTAFTSAKGVKWEQLAVVRLHILCVGMHNYTK